MTSPFLPPVSSPDDVRLAAGTRHTCALINGSDLYCMGSDIDGATGVGDTNIPTMAGYPAVGRPQAIVAAERSTCLVYDDGQVRCRGENTFGVVPPAGSGIVPWSRVVEMGNAVQSVFSAGGARHVCALSFAGQLYCWGDSAGGKLGTGATTMPQPPALVSQLTP